MVLHKDIPALSLRNAIRRNKISFAGNIKLKIYGKLNCRSGKRMRMGTRVFFHLEKEALQQGFRPCALCMHIEYKKWKDGSIQ
ncbi:MAG: Ada metal-binding domain-containing protein [Ferruginibacter sp.]